MSKLDKLLKELNAGHQAKISRPQKGFVEKLKDLFKPEDLNDDKDKNAVSIPKEKFGEYTRVLRKNFAINCAGTKPTNHSEFNKEISDIGIELTNKFDEEDKGDYKSLSSKSIADFISHQIQSSKDDIIERTRGYQEMYEIEFRQKNKINEGDKIDIDFKIRETVTNYLKSIFNDSLKEVAQGKIHEGR